MVRFSRGGAVNEALFKFAQDQQRKSVFVEKHAQTFRSLGCASWQTKRKEGALVPIKSKLVVAVCKVDFSEITLMRNVNVMWAGGKCWLDK